MGFADGYIELTKAEFDALARQSAKWSEPPMLDGFGDGHGEPYVPNRRARGTLKDGRKVYAWVRGKNPNEGTR